MSESSHLQHHDCYHQFFELPSPFDSTRMGYPILGVAYGQFTDKGWVRHREGNQKLIDNQFFGVNTGSIADNIIVNIGNPVPIEINGHQPEPIKVGSIEIEIDILRMFANYFGIDPNDLSGYVTAGGTEGNLACLWWARNHVIFRSKKIIHEIEEILLAIKDDISVKKETRDYSIALYLHEKYQFLSSHLEQHKKPILYASEHAHYSIHKIADILDLELRLIPVNDKKEISIEHLARDINDVVYDTPARPMILCVTLGTTQYGAVDDFIKIKKLVQTITKESESNFFIHADAALMGPVLPLLNPYKNIGNFFGYIDSMAISGHKFLGTTSVCGVALIHRGHLELSFSEKEIIVRYARGIQDTTLLGTRSGYSALELHHAMCIFDFNTDYCRVKKMYQQCTDNAKYLYDNLVKLHGKKEDVFWSDNKLIVTFLKPSNIDSTLLLQRKYGLMPVGDDHFSVCILANVDRYLIDIFLADYEKFL